MNATLDPGRRGGAGTILFAPDGRVRAIIRCLLYAGIGYLIIVLTESAAFSLFTPKNWTTGEMIAQSVSVPLLIGLAALFLAMLDQRSFHTLGLWFYKGWGRELAIGLGIGAAMMILTVGVTLAARAISYAGAPPGLAAEILRLLRLALLLALAASLEELYFRGYAFQRLVESAGKWGAVLILSVLFGLAHMRNPSASAFSVANTVLAGVLLSVAYLKTRALWLPIGLHFAWNYVQGPIFSLPVSGIGFARPLLNVNVSGPTWLSGGNYGPEGGVIVTGVTLAAILWLLLESHIRTSPGMEEVLK